MKICFLGSFSGGGTEKAVADIANELCQKKGLYIYILSTKKNKNVFYLNPAITFRNLLSESILGRNVEVYKYIRENRIDVFITIEALTGFISIFPTKLFGCKHIVWEHANYFQNQGSRYIQKIRQLELYIVDAYIVLTKRDLNNFKSNFRIKTRLEYIYNIANKPTTSTYNLDSKTIISVGLNRYIKNFISIPDIGKMVFSRHPDWRWEIYGKSGKKEKEELLQKISRLELEDNIFFCDWCDEMDRVYQKASMYVMTSLQEGLPMVLLEAKSHKLPIVSFDIETGPDEIIRNEKNGFLIKSYDVVEMAVKINELIDNDEKRKEFSENSIVDMENFDKDRIVYKWINLINSI